jgi:ATP-dependent RNA helicase RhlE
MSFRELGLSELLLRAVAAEGYATATPIQCQAIPVLLAGRDLLGSAQTGTGKTAAFALPVLHRLMDAAPGAQGRRPRIRALVLTPTRELASQVGDNFRSYGRHTDLSFATIYGGVGQGTQTRALRQGVDVLVATPGRLIDLMEQGFVDLSGVEIFVLDEADRMLDLGFLPPIRRIVAKLPARRQTILLSATMPEPIIGLARSLLREPVRVEIEPVRATTDLIDHSVHHVSRHDKPKKLAKLLDAKSVERALVFTRTKRGADRVVKQLFLSGVRAEAIHGNKSQSARQRALTNFKLRRTRVLVATDIAARGIDVEGISHVFNYDLPNEPETYVHRIGRTGRAGASGAAVSLCDSDERRMLNAIERLIRRKLSVVGSLSTPSQPEHSTRTTGPAVQKPAPAPREVDADGRAPRRLSEANSVPRNFGGRNVGAQATKDQSPSGKPARNKWRSSRRRRRTIGLKSKGV